MIEIVGLFHRKLSIDRLLIGRGFTSIIGPNGGGKTTLLRLLSGIDTPASGSIRIDGISPRQLHAGWVNEYPDRNLLFSRVYDEIASPLRFLKKDCEEADIRVREISERIGLNHLLDRPVASLSGGEKALVAVATALVLPTELLLLDEYDSHLDPGRRGQIDNAIKAVAPSYVVRCTQLMDTAAAGDRVIALEDGRITREGSPYEVFRHLENTPFYPPSWRSHS